MSEWCKYFLVLTVVCFLDEDLTVHINVSVEQHTHSLKQLLHNISTNQEAMKELSRWGLEISSDILVVRTHTHTHFRSLTLFCRLAILHITFVLFFFFLNCSRDICFDFSESIQSAGCCPGAHVVQYRLLISHRAEQTL